MKKRTKWLLVFIIVIVAVFLFFPFRNDENKVDLGNHYFFVPSEDVVFDVTTYDGATIFLVRDSQYVPVIFPNVINYKYDSLYIIAEQDFDLQQTKILVQNVLFRQNQFKYEKSLVPLDDVSFTVGNPSVSTILEEKYVDSLVQKDSHIKSMMQHKKNYYLISKSHLKVYGPFDENSFKIAKKKLNVDLKF